MGESKAATSGGQTAAPQTELKRVLSLSSLVFYGLAFMVPLTIFTTYGIATELTHGMVPVTYVVATACMAFTAFSYVRMTKVYPVAGSVYTFVHKSINPYLGFLSGWAILLGYIFLPMLNYLASALFLSNAIPQVAPWIWVVLMACIVTVVNHFGIKVADIFNKAIVWIQLIFLITLLIIACRYILGGNGAATLFDYNAFINVKEFSKPGMGFPVLLSGAAILALGYLGFDAIATLSEEAVNPGRDIGRAIIIACVGAGLMFTFMTYIIQLAWPEAWFQLGDKVDDAAYPVIEKIAGSVMAYFFTGAYCVGCLASSIGSVASASRVLYGMGRDKILPKQIFAYLHPRYKTPTFSILLIGGIGILALVISLTVAASLLNFGALLGFVMVNLCVISHYFIKNKQRDAKGILKYLIAPLIGAAFTFMLWINLDKTSMLLGLSWMVVGVAYLAITTKFFTKLPPEMSID